MDEIILAIGGIVLLIIFVVAAILGAYTNSLPDKKREELGLGPKGQGRDR
jgi:hypothetical protein